MTQSEFINGFNNFIKQKYQAYQGAKNYSVLPRDTGNLQDRAFKFKVDGEEWQFYIDSAIAPYAQYINSIKWGPTWWDNHFYETVVNDLVEYFASEGLNPRVK